MATLLQLAIVLLLLSNFVLLAADRVGPQIRLMSFQGGLLAAILLFTPHAGNSGLLHGLFLAGAIILIKTAGFPILLHRTLHKIHFRERPVPHTHKYAVLGGIIALLFSFWLETRIPSVRGIYPQLLFPASLMTLFSGLVIVVTRIRALGQVIGYLVAENGIFLLGIPLMMESSTWFELSLLLDVFAAVFVMGIAINYISETFDSIDVGRFCSLRD